MRRIVLVLAVAAILLVGLTVSHADQCSHKSRIMRRKIVSLFIAAFTSIFSAGACGGQGDVNEREQDVKAKGLYRTTAILQGREEVAAQNQNEAGQDVKEEQPKKPESAGDTVPVVVPGTNPTIARWLKSEGDAVTAGEPLLELETDKASFEIDAEQDGVLQSIWKGDGETVGVGEVIGSIQTQIDRPQIP